MIDRNLNAFDSRLEWCSMNTDTGTDSLEPDFLGPDSLGPRLSQIDFLGQLSETFQAKVRRRTVSIVSERWNWNVRRYGPQQTIGLCDGTLFFSRFQVEHN